MPKRLLLHGAFWLLYMLLQVTLQMFFAASSDMAYPPVPRFLRFFFTELAFLPWKVIPFYLLFYVLVPKYFARKEYGKMGLWLLLIMVICLLGTRSMVGPANQLLYGETPNYEMYSLKRFLYSLMEFLPAIALASTVKLLKGRVESQQKVEALQAEKRTSELNFLKAQTNPHFLFNTLNNLYGLARKQDTNTAPSIMKLANIMRYILNECRSDRIPVSKEIEVIEAYIELEKLRYDDRLTVKFLQSIDDHRYEIAPLILLPFVENAFKHGASESRFDIAIEINLRVEAGEMYFSIKNTADQGDEALKEGIGLSNARRQLALIYRDKYRLEIKPEKALFEVELWVGEGEK